MFTDKIEHTQQPLEDVNTEELVSLLKEISESGQVNLASLLQRSDTLISGSSDESLQS